MKLNRTIATGLVLALATGIGTNYAASARGDMELKPSQKASTEETIISLNTSKEGIKHLPGGSDPQLPYLISPRYTLLLNEKPNIRWNAVAGANLYLVRIEGPGVEWQAETKETEIVYSDSQKLEPGIAYKVTVEADTGAASMDDPGAKLGFRIVRLEQAQWIEQEVRKINQSDLSEAEKAMAIAKLYNDKMLKTEAIAILKTLANQGNETAAVDKMLGDIYAETGLNLLAEASYNQAIEQASVNQDKEMLTEAQAGLAGVKLMLGKKEEAEELANLAQAGYQEQGDTATAELVMANLENLENRGSLLENPIEGVRGGEQQQSAQEQIEEVIAPQGQDWP